MNDYRVFTRTFYKIVNGKKINKLGRKMTYCYASSASEAADICHRMNALPRTAKQERESRKYEFMKE